MKELKFVKYKQMVSSFLDDLSKNNILIELGLSFSEQNVAEASKLNIAFVGQYSSGKSSLIKGLTGIKEILIGSGVTTDKVTQYEYKDLVLWDTPGIRAGKNEQHDEDSFAAMDQADLLVYVITNELFDDILGAAFRDLCFAKGRENEILLVINKSQRDAGTPETKLKAIAEILEPRIPEDFPVVFVDAESYFEALVEEDIEDKSELMDLSNFAGFVEAIDNFSHERGLIGRVTTPLASIQTQLEALLAKLAAEDPTQEVLSELLQQKNRIIKANQKQLQEQFDGVLSEMEQNILLFGDELAEHVDDGLSQSDFEEAQKRSVDKVEKQVKQTQSKTEKLVDSSLSTLKADLKELDESPLAESLKATLDDHFQALDQLKINSDIKIDTKSIGEKHEASVKTQKTLDTAEKGFSWLSSQAINTSAKEGARVASGSNLHKTVLDVGHFFGHKFKPYQAIKITEKIGSAARFIGPVTALLGVIVQVSDDIQQESRASALVDARRDIRKSYREIFVDLKQEFIERMQNLISSCHLEEISYVSEALQDLQNTSDANIEQRDEVAKAIAELNNLREKLNVE